MAKEKEQEQEITDFEYARIKKLCTNFFYWWYNSPGNNTEEGFETWFKKHGHKIW